MRVEVNPGLLRWSVERSRLDDDYLSKKFPKLGQWLDGAVQPTLKQLENFATTTRTPVGYFFLDEPPAERLPIPDFRTVGSEEIQRPSPDLLDTIHLCQQRQEWYRGFARSIGDEPLPFVGSASLTSDVVKIAAQIRKLLEFDLDEQRKCPTWTDALRHFITLADASGVLVMVSGIVGSNTHRKLDPDEFRGFTLADPLAPLIFVNGADTKAAQMFTLAHELAHVWLGQSGISDEQASMESSNATERWCNAVAAELLVPLSLIRAEYDGTASLNSEMTRLARRFKVSTLVILRRIHDAGFISWKRLQEAYRSELRSLRESSRAGAGGNFYLTLGARVSKRFARAIVADTLEGRSSYTEAFRLLGFKRMTTFRELGQNLGLVV